MKINANSIRVGNILEYEKELWIVLAPPSHVKPGKGPAYVQLVMRNVKTGSKLNTRFSSSDTVEKVRLDQKDYQFLFLDGDNIALMDTETYDQITIPSDILEEKVAFLQDGMVVTVESYEDQPLNLILPETVVLEIVEAEPVVKGQTAASSYKPAIMNNGIRVMVPPFVEVGDKIIVKTEDSSYVERAK
jgi:elongation factor P